MIRIIKLVKKRHFPITYEGSRQHAESNLNKKPLTGPRYSINTDIMSDIFEENKNSYEDLEEIAAEMSMIYSYQLIMMMGKMLLLITKLMVRMM